MKDKQLSRLGTTLLMMIVLLAMLAQAYPWSCADASPHRLWHDVTQALEVSTLTPHSKNDEFVLLDKGKGRASGIRWPD
ncbi:hypothetical protein [Burkholderia cepacia]|uniref:hypothetical protein n=1 Tax=Burkholderia cepacia TaxID=292 RepID=UPI001F17B5AD|nr:hypothetical protein [Burkholderia cepacia]MCE4124489.1 hypothetical protein [Burkholderia cepacia]